MITTPARAIVLGGWAAGGFDCISGVVGDLDFSWARGWALPHTAKASLPHHSCLLLAALPAIGLPQNIRTPAGISTKAASKASSLPTPVLAENVWKLVPCVLLVTVACACVPVPVLSVELRMVYICLIAKVYMCNSCVCHWHCVSGILCVCVTVGVHWVSALWVCVTGCLPYVFLKHCETLCAYVVA